MTTARKHPLMQLVKARVLVFVREPATLFWVFLFPVLLALVLGMAFRDRPPEPPRVGVAADAPKLELLRTILAQNADVTFEEHPADVLQERLDKGSIDIVVRLDEHAPIPNATYQFDPQRPDARYARLVVDREIQEHFGRTNPVTISDATAMPKGARYIDFLLPGLIAMNLMGSALWGVGYGMVQERAKKLMRRFATTPLSRTQFIGSYIISRLTFLSVEVAFLIGFGALVFDVTVQGNVLLLLLTALLGVMCFTGFAVLCASRTSSVEVVSGFVNALTLPMWLLSGTFFSYERFPEAMHPIIQVLPLTALNDALRAITNDGAGLAEIAPQVGILAGWGLVTFVLGVRLFRWK